MSILVTAVSLLGSRIASITHARVPPHYASSSVPFLRTYVRLSYRARKALDRARARSRSLPYSSNFPIPSAVSILSLYRALLRTAARFPDDLVRWYVVARCRTEWREHRAAHRATYQAEQQAVYEKQKARLQVKERLERIQARESDEAATRAALDMHFDPLQLAPPRQLHITPDTPHVSLSLHQKIHQRYKDAQQHLQLLQAALHHTDPPTLASSRTEVLCAVYGWRGGTVLDRLFHLRGMYLNAPNMLQPATLLALHPLHRYLVTGVRPEDERPVVSDGRRPAVGVYEWWPVEKSDRLRGDSPVCGARWMECYRLLIMQRCQVLDVQWRRAYSDMLRQRQNIGAPGEIEQPGSVVDRKRKTEADASP